MKCPIVLRKEGLDELIVRFLRLEAGPPNLRDWDAMVQKLKRPTHDVTIGMVGKYMAFKESYKSLSEALVHGGLSNETGGHDPIDRIGRPRTEQSRRIFKRCRWNPDSGWVWHERD